MEQSFKYGIFKKEIKNRFLCIVDVGGEDTLCYIPASCRLSNFLDLTGHNVLLCPILSPNSRTKFSVFALATGKSYVLLNMAKVNKIIESNIKSRYFSLLGKRLHIKKEFQVNGYKSDLYIEDTKTIVEIKSILSFSKTKEVDFPSVHSDRAIEQLKKISGLLDMNYKACYIFVSLNPKFKKLKINRIYKEYYLLFKQCIEKGMKVKGVSLKLVDGKILINSSLPVIVE